MTLTEPPQKFFFYSLVIFFAVSTASIALQNLVWVPVLYLGWLYLRNRHQKILRLDAFDKWTLLWIFTFYLGALLGVNPGHSLETVHRYLTILLVLFVGSMGLGVLEIQKLLKAFTWGTVFCAICGIGKHLIFHQTRIDSFSGDKMVFAGLLMTALLIQTGSLMNRPKDLTQWTGVILNSWALLLTETRGAWMGLGAGFLMLGWRFNRRWLFAGLFLAVVGYFFLPAYIQERVKSITRLDISYNENHEIGDSSQTRVLIWIAGVHIIKDYPFGIGQGNIGEVFPKYKTQALGEATEPHLHNNFLQITAQNGWLGLAAYLGWILCYFLTAFKYQAAEPLGREINWTLACCFGGTLVWGLTEFTFSQQFMYLQYSLLGLQAGLWKREIETSTT